MLGELNSYEIESLLKQHNVGRIGGVFEGVPYILPVNYVYENDIFYAHSGDGFKINLMRSNPYVCFQVDEIKTLFDWQSVLAWGTYKEIHNHIEKEKVMQKLINHLSPSLCKHETGHPSHGITDDPSNVGDGVELIVYKILVDKKTGRFEKPGK